MSVTSFQNVLSLSFAGTVDAAGVDRQERDCRKLAKQLGLAVRKIYVDNDISASTATGGSCAVISQRDTAPNPPMITSVDG